jgi:hypothetical protein
MIKNMVIFNGDKDLGSETNFSAKQHKTVSRTRFSGSNEQPRGQECAQTKEGKRPEKIIR